MNIPRVTIVASALLLAATAIPALAASGATMAAATPTQSAATAGAQKTGTGQSVDAGQNAARAIDMSEAPDNQPWMATGLDLKGPPMRFPAAETPE